MSLGIRPEDLHLRQPGSSSDDRASARVNVIEPLGSEMMLYVNAHGQDLVCRVDSHQKVRVGEDVSVEFDMQKAHFFDVGTGENLTVK